MDTDFLLDTLAAMIIAQYSYNSCRLTDDCWDASIQEHAIVHELKKRQVTLKQIDDRIAAKDFTGQLTRYGSGNRERGFVMEYIEEIYNEEE